MVFYKLQVGRDHPFIEISKENDWEEISCSENSGHQRAGRRLTGLFLDVLSLSVVDFSRTVLSDVVITDKALSALRGARLTGFTAAPTIAVRTPRDARRTRLPRLWELVIVGQAGRAHEQSGIAELRHCRECGLVEYSAYKNGIVVNQATYDGSDFCTVQEYPKHILVSERARSVIETNKLSNVGFVDSALLTWPKGVVKPT